MFHVRWFPFPWFPVRYERNWWCHKHKLVCWGRGWGLGMRGKNIPLPHCVPVKLSQALAEWEWGWGSGESVHMVVDQI